jgi:hypothetical protein
MMPSKVPSPKKPGWRDVTEICDLRTNLNLGCRNCVYWVHVRNGKSHCSQSSTIERYRAWKASLKEQQILTDSAIADKVRTARRKSGVMR